MKEIGRPCLAILAAALWLGSGSIVEAQPPIRIGASLSQTGAFASLGQNQLRGYQLCVKQANEKGGALKRGLRVVVAEAYPKGTTDFSGILGKVKAASPDVLAAATYFEDAVAITRRLKELGLNPKMFGVTVGGNLPKFYETLGRAAEFVYGASQWEPELVTLRAGGLIPIARQYPGAKEFVEGAPHRVSRRRSLLSLRCRVRRLPGPRGGAEARGVPGRREDPRGDSPDGLQTPRSAPSRWTATGSRSRTKALVFQWQDGKKVIVWPEELAPGKPRFPTPPWSQRQ